MENTKIASKKLQNFDILYVTMKLREVDISWTLKKEKSWQALLHTLQKIDNLLSSQKYNKKIEVSIS